MFLLSDLLFLLLKSVEQLIPSSYGVFLGEVWSWSCLFPNYYLAWKEWQNKLGLDAVKCYLKGHSLLCTEDLQQPLDIMIHGCEYIYQQLWHRLAIKRHAEMWFFWRFCFYGNVVYCSCIMISTSILRGIVKSCLHFFSAVPEMG